MIAGLVISWSTVTAILGTSGLAGSAIALFLLSGLRTSLAVSQASVEVITNARLIDKQEAAAEAKRLAEIQVRQEAKCRDDIARLTGQVEVLTSNTLDRLVGAATTSLTKAMHDVFGEQMELLREMDVKLSQGVETVERMEAAAGVVADDLSASHGRADAVDTDHAPGTASDAASRSDPTGNA